MKTCRDCQRSLSSSHYSTKTAVCRDCRADYDRRRQYNIEASEYQTLFETQEGRCGICSCDGPLVVDHCHHTNRVRGLLCSPCNRGIGFLRDSNHILLAAAAWVDPMHPNHAEIALHGSRI